MCEFKVKQFDRHYEKAVNHIKRAGADPVLLESVNADASELEGFISELATSVETSQADPSLSPKGKQAAIEAAQEKAVDGIAKANKAGTLDAGIANLQAQLKAATERFFKDNSPSELMLSYWQEAETRNYLLRLRDDKRAEHESWLEQEKQASRPVSDLQRAFPDPVEQLYIEACHSPSPDKAQLLRAISGAPWPIETLPGQTVEQGLNLLARSLKPEAAQQHDQAALRAEAYAVLMNGVAELIGKPEALRTKKVKQPVGLKA